MAFLPDETFGAVDARRAPCSAAIVEAYVADGIRPTGIFFPIPVSYPQQEFDTRKHELIRFLQQQDVPYVEDEYDHADWKEGHSWTGE